MLVFDLKINPLFNGEIIQEVVTPPEFVVIPAGSKCKKYLYKTGKGHEIEGVIKEIDTKKRKLPIIQKDNVILIPEKIKIKGIRRNIWVYILKPFTDICIKGW